jgi:cell division protein FtsA
MHGFRLHVDTHIVTVSTELVQNLTRCLTRLGIGIEGLVLESLASAEAALTEDERQNGVVLVDIGGADTGIAVFKGGSVYHTATVPVGGNHITHDIAVGLGIPFELAEETKQKHGNAIIPPELAPLEVALGENGYYKISRYDLCEIINARLDELIRLIRIQLPWEDLAEVVPCGLVLTGGSSRLTGIDHLASAVSHLPARVGIPVNPDSESEVLQDPAFATGVGLLQWKIRNTGSQDLSTSRWGMQVLLPRWLGYFGGRRLETPVASERR